MQILSDPTIPIKKFKVKNLKLNLRNRKNDRVIENKKFKNPINN